MTTPAETAAEPRAEQAIVAAARRCFARFGVPRTRMSDVANEAGMVRQTLYTFVSGREQLIELALIDWCRDLRDRLEAAPRRGPRDPESDLVETLARAIELTRADPEFGELAQALTRTRATELLAGASPVHAIVLDALGPALHRARPILRTDATDGEMVSWLSTILAVMTARNDLTGGALRDFLRRFAIRAITAAEPEIPARR